MLRFRNLAINPFPTTVRRPYDGIESHPHL
jgi:hypothetical protein